MTMVFDHIDKVKQEYTDKYVVVDRERPELARFGDLVGQVKTVNMSGRALVEFVDYHLNIGWYDIDLDYLKVVDKPAPKEKKPIAKKPASKPAAKKPPTAEPGQTKLSPLEMARMQGAAKKPGSSTAKPAGGKPSTADILAAARGGAKAAKPADAPKPASAGKMSTADILAAARGGKQEDEPASQITEESIALESEPSAEKTAAAESSSAADGNGTAEKVDRSTMSVADMIAWCRANDAN